MLAIGLVTLVMAVVLALNTRQQIMAGGERAMQSRAANLAEGTSHALDTVDLVERVLLSRIRRAKITDQRALAAFMADPTVLEDLRERISTLPQIRSIAVNGVSGTLLFSTRRPDEVGRDDSRRPSFQDFLAPGAEGPIFGAPYYDPDTHGWLMLMTRQIKAPDGTLIGVVGAAVNLSYFATFYGRMLPNDWHTVALLRDDATMLVIVPERSEVIGRKFPALKSFQMLKPGMQSVLVPIGQGLVTGQQRLVAAQRVAHYPLRLDASITTAAALKPWMAQLQLLVLSVLLTEAMIAGILIVLRKRAAAQAGIEALRETNAEAERQRLAGAQELERLVAIMPGTVVRLERVAEGDWITRFISPAITSLTGFSIKQLSYPKFLLSRLDLQGSIALQRGLEEALAHGQSTIEVNFRNRARRILRLSAKIAAVRTEDGGAELVMVWTDVTAEREMQAQLLQTSKLATLGELATGMAHELNQPLASISLAAENAARSLHRMDDPGETVTQKLNLISDLAMRASEIVDHMRIFGRNEETPSHPVQLMPLLHDMVALLRGKLQQAGVLLVYDVPDDLPPMLARSVPLEQVLLNVVANACDAYADRQDREPAQPDTPKTVTISARVCEQAMRISIADHAGGIAETVLPRVFEPFFTTKPVGQGTGLGLSISYGIIVDMRGQITVRNVDGGAEFIITLPLAPDFQPDTLAAPA